MILSKGYTKVFEKSVNSVVCLVVLWTLFFKGNSVIIVSPNDTEVRVGDSTYLNCSISDASATATWYHYPVGKTSREIVFLRNRVRGPYDKRFRAEMDSSTGSFNLVISKANLEDAGKYVCEDGESADPKVAQVIVLEGDPTCQSNINASGFIGPNDCGLQQDIISMSCSVNFKGNVPPKLQWMRIKGSNSFAIDDSLLTCSSSDPIGSVTCNYTAASDIDFDGSHFACQTNASRNALYRCSTDVVKIYYAMENKTSIAKTVGDEVACFANTNSLECKYEWIQFDGVNEKTMSQGIGFTIEENGWHRCEANCKVKDMECLFTAVLVNASANTSLKHWTINAIQAVVAGFVLCIFILLFLYRKKILHRLKREATPKALPPEERSLIGNRRERQLSEHSISDETVSRKTQYPNSRSPEEIRTEFIVDNLSFKNEFEHIETIEVNANSVISGITLLSRKLYVACENCSDINAYDSESLKYDSKASLDMRNYLTNPLDIASSISIERLYVVDLPNEQSKCRLKSLDVTGRVRSHWFVDDKECRLSVCEANVIVCLPNRNQVIEYSPEGEEVFRFKLSPGNGFLKPWHAIKVSESKYAVSHRVPVSGEHRLSIVRTFGQTNVNASKTCPVRVAYTTTPQTCGMNVPICLVRGNEDHIFVADYLNNRVLLVHTDKNACEVLIRDGRIKNLKSYGYLKHHPLRMCPDEFSERMFVAQGDANSKTGIVSIFKKKDESLESSFEKHDAVGENLSYTKAISHVKTINTKTIPIITGITLLSNKLYIAYKKCSTIKVYNNVSSSFDFERNLETRDLLIDPFDIASSKASKCLYVVDMRSDQSFHWHIKMLDINGNLLRNWYLDDYECRLSVNVSNIIVCLPNKQQLVEYSYEGWKVCKVSLAKDERFDKLWHAIKLNKTRYVVSHRLPQSDEHQVSILEIHGTTDNYSVVFATSPKICGLNTPISLVHDRKGRILVAENLNNRVLLIDPDSKTCEVILRDGRLKNLRSRCIIQNLPVRMCLESTKETEEEILVIASGDSSAETGVISSFKMQDTTK